MAEFCTKCAPEIWVNDVREDINIDKIYESLEPGTGESVLCEGCGLMAVGKTLDNEMLLAVPTNVDHSSQMVGAIKWVTREEFIALQTYI